MSFFVKNIDINDSSKTIKNYLLSKNLSSEKIKYLLNNNCCYVNGMIVSENHELKIKDSLCIDTCFFDDLDYSPTECKIDVLYEDEYLLLVNKPSKCIIYDDIKHDTMANYIAYYYMINNLDYKIRHAHRLDYDTSGCLLYAKDIITHAALNKIIENGSFKRYYLAVVEKNLDKKTGKINYSIGKDRHINGKMIISKTGKQAITNYIVKKDLNGYSVVSLLLETGRTHQIRVHMSAIKHPLVGDSLYGSKTKFNRVLLHSHKVDFIHPITNKHIVIECPIPNDMKEFINKKSAN